MKLPFRLPQLPARIVPDIIHNRKHGALVLFIFSLALQVSLLLFFHNIYGLDTHIRLVNADRIIVRHWLPLFQIILAAFFKVTSNEVAFLLLMSVISSLGVAFFYLWLRKLMEDTPAFAAALFLSVHYEFVFFTRMPYLEGLTFFLLSATLFFLEERRPMASWTFYLLACLTRSEAWILAPVMIARQYYLDSRLRARTIARFLAPPLLAFLIFLIFIAGEAHDYFDPASGFFLSAARLTDHPFVYFVRTFGDQIAHFILNFDLLFFFLSVTGLIILLTPRKGYWPYLALPFLLLFHSLINGFTLGFYFHRTFLLPKLFLLGFGVFLIVKIGEVTRKRVPAVLLTLYLALNLILLVRNVAVRDAIVEPYKQAGQWLGAHTPSTNTVLVVSEVDPEALNWRSYSYIITIFYSKRRVGETYLVKNDFGNLEDLQLFLARRQVKYVLLDRDNTAQANYFGMLERRGDVLPKRRLPGNYTILEVREV